LPHRLAVDRDERDSTVAGDLDHDGEHARVEVGLQRGGRCLHALHVLLFAGRDGLAKLPRFNERLVRGERTREVELVLRLGVELVGAPKRLDRLVDLFLRTAISPPRGGPASLFGRGRRLGAERHEEDADRHRQGCRGPSQHVRMLFR
jgi:hypothetical protein